jgi:hypothetical protein
MTDEQFVSYGERGKNLLAAFDAWQAEHRPATQPTLVEDGPRY